jgi:protein-S-isoprenylcysteine O-methyltransferase Ste14
MMFLGLLLRIWAARTLGEFYTRTLVVGTHQMLVEKGPYRWLRHPGYFGDIVLWFGVSTIICRYLRAPSEYVRK